MDDHELSCPAVLFICLFSLIRVTLRTDIPDLHARFEKTQRLLSLLVWPRSHGRFLGVAAAHSTVTGSHR